MRNEHSGDAKEDRSHLEPLALERTGGSDDES
jgi:hypothetical protein